MHIRHRISKTSGKKPRGQLGTTRHATDLDKFTGLYCSSGFMFHVRFSRQSCWRLSPFCPVQQVRATISTKVLSVSAHLVPSSTIIAEKTVANSTPVTTNILQSRLVTVDTVANSGPINVELLESYLLKARLHRRFLLRSFSFWCMWLNELIYECIRPSVQSYIDQYFCDSTTQSHASEWEKSPQKSRV